MKSTPYVLGIIIMVILALAVGLAFKNNDQKLDTTGTNTATSTSPTAVSDLIHVENPVINQVIASGFELKGEARGNWYFEASFPAKIVDANGKVLAQFPVSADGEWMTTNFVPFAQVVTFPAPETSTGSLILEKDNASGLPEFDASLVIPIKFATSSVATTTVKVYFSNDKMAGVSNTDCSKVFSINRTIPKTAIAGRAAIEELLKGPTATDLKSGYNTNISTSTKLNSLVITNGVARADFNEALDYQVAGSCRVTAIRSQIERTLKQFPTVKEVIISVNRNSEEVLQP